MTTIYAVEKDGLWWRFAGMGGLTTGPTIRNSNFTDSALGAQIIVDKYGGDIVVFHRAITETEEHHG